MAKKKILWRMLAVALAFVSGGLDAQQPVVAVAPFDAISGINSTEANMITRVFFIRLGNTNKVSLVDRSVVERVLREHAFQAGDWSDQKKTAELGTALNADWIVRGEMEKFGSNILVTVQFYDIRTFRFMGGADLRLANADEAYDKMDPLVNKLVETISGGGSVTPAGFVLVPAGTFSMGSNNGEEWEKPVHQVTINKAFYMSDHEVTQKEWVEVMGMTIRQQKDMMDKTLPLCGEGDNYPMYYVSWYDAIEYCNKRSIKERLAPAYTIDKTRSDGNNSNEADDMKWVVTWNRNANGYRLPTEAEWEWAAKGGGKDFMIYEYSGSNSVDGVAWYDGNSENRTHPVKTKAGNSLGLYDMSGNIYELCWDWYGSYSGSSQTDPAGAAGGSYRVIRGGSWYFDAQGVRSTYRLIFPPLGRAHIIGFRLVRQ
jgi:formylglycine-generating enzyme required for sulfatase activity